MRKLLYLSLVFSLALGLSLNTLPLGSVSAAEGEIGIKDMISKDTLLMEDGSLWAKNALLRSVPYPFNAEKFTGNDYFVQGITSNGALFTFELGELYVVPGFTGIKQVSGGYYLKNDGTVWTEQGQIKKLKDIALIDGSVALTKNGDILLPDRNDSSKYKTLATVPDAASVTSMTVGDGMSMVALLYSSGKVVVYATFEFDDNGKIVPYTVTEEATHVSFAGSSTLLVTLRDGTVWRTGEYSARSKLTASYAGLSQIVKTAAAESEEDFYAKRSDGSWVHYEEGEVTPFKAPFAKALDVKASNTKPYVGDSIDLAVEVTYSNGVKVTAPASTIKVSIQKPHLLSLQGTSKLKALGVGQTQVTVTASGMSKSFTISSSLRNNLAYSKVVNGVVYVPIKSVFQALGGTATAANGAFAIKVGDTTLSLKAGDANATLNGKAIKLKAAPITEKGNTLFPSSLLIDVFGAKVTWNTQWKQAEIAFGDAKLTVVSADTAGLIKKAEQGSLAKYIGKSYWVNSFQGWTRFMKVTVSDILPDDTGSYTIVFKTASGTTLKSYPMFASYVDTLFADSSSFFTYDPNKKNDWSASIWQQIKAGKISLGMTKEQVRMAWGSPISINVTSAEGRSVEAWVYPNLDSVGFVDGKVVLIIS